MTFPRLPSSPSAREEVGGAAAGVGFEFISVVIPVLNGASTLPQQLDALAAQTYSGSWEVIVVDNGSTDGSAKLALDWFDRLPHLRIVHALDRKGCSYARNVGARSAQGRFLVFCDSDDVVAPDWITWMVETGKTCDLVGGRLDQKSLNSPKTRTWRPRLPEDRLPVALGFLPYAVGANCGLRTELFHALGGWREDLPICGDDVDFSWRAQLASYRLCYAPAGVVNYRFRESPRATARQFYNYGLMEPVLFRDYRAKGMRSSRLTGALREWIWLLLRIGDLWGPSGRKGAWMRKAAYRWGRVVGSLRAKVLFL